MMNQRVAEGTRPTIAVCETTDENEITFLAAYLKVQHLDPIVIATATDGGGMTRFPNVPVSVEDLSLEDCKRFVNEVEAVANQLQVPLIVGEEMWQAQ